MSPIDSPIKSWNLPGHGSVALPQNPIPLTHVPVLLPSVANRIGLVRVMITGGHLDQLFVGQGRRIPTFDMTSSTSGVQAKVRLGESAISGELLDLAGIDRHQMRADIATIGSRYSRRHQVWHVTVGATGMAEVGELRVLRFVQMATFALDCGWIAALMDSVLMRIMAGDTVSHTVLGGLGRLVVYGVADHDPSRDDFRSLTAYMTIQAEARVCFYFH